MAPRISLGPADKDSRINIFANRTRTNRVSSKPLPCGEERLAPTLNLLG